MRPQYTIAILASFEIQDTVNPNRAKNRLGVADHFFLSNGLQRIAVELKAPFRKQMDDLIFSNGGEYFVAISTHARPQQHPMPERRNPFANAEYRRPPIRVSVRCNSP
jgi:hypothetical protein